MYVLRPLLDASVVVVLVRRNTPRSEISSCCCRVDDGKIMTRIFTATATPAYTLYGGIYVCMSCVRYDLLRVVEQHLLLLVVVE